MQVHNPATSDLKCPTCYINFKTSQQHKQHYKADFHRYNLKRKMVNLAPATYQQFKSKKMDVKAEQSSEFKCNQCGKKFNSVNTFNQHVQTKKHNPNTIVNKQNKDVKDKQPIKFKKNSKMCIFCQKQSSNFAENIRHMQSSHSFSIPQQKYCTNQQGLVEYLQQKVEIGFMCITCENKNAKDFSTGLAVRKHMNDKGHVSMKTDQGYDEYLEYYDFSSQFKEILQSQKDKYVPGIQYTTLKVIVKQGQMELQDNKMKQQGNDEDWEDQNSQSDSDEQQRKDKKGQQDKQWQSQSDEQEKQTQIKEKEQQPQKKKSKIKTYHIMRPTHTANGQLLLPNGKILGHRKYRYLYRQTYRQAFWLNKDIKALGYQFAKNALISRQRLLELAKHDKLLYKFKNKWNKKQLRNGMNNNTQKYFRTSNSL